MNPSKSIAAGRITGDERIDERGLMAPMISAATDITAWIGPSGSNGAVSDSRSRTSTALAGAWLRDPTSWSTSWCHARA